MKDSAQQLLRKTNMNVHVFNSYRQTSFEKLGHRTSRFPKQSSGHMGPRSNKGAVANQTVISTLIDVGAAIVPD